MRKIKQNILILFVILAVFACKKKIDDPAPAEAAEPSREVIEYWLSVIPRAENKINKDTLIIKINGTEVISAKGSVADVYPVKKVKTGDQVSIYYNPGKVVTTNSVTLIDDNGLLLMLDYSVNNNKKLKEYSCRCIANEVLTIE
ncbi:MAG: hypothetical protein IPM51_06685 [Sphingobacteriaceae bacterium]|nr:hypothetical protein [Sphingobacteriaceae bacterium]